MHDPCYLSEDRVVGPRLLHQGEHREGVESDGIVGLDRADHVVRSVMTDAAWNHSAVSLACQLAAARRRWIGESSFDIVVDRKSWCAPDATSLTTCPTSPGSSVAIRHMGDTLHAMDLPELLVVDAGAWRRWLRTHHADSLGVWLVLAKKGTADPTTISYDEALDEAICFGWIDGQLGRRDTATFRRRFTPRKARSPWSQRNAAIAERLIASGRMHRSGEDEVRQAKEDGRWEAAYAGQASIEVPEDLLAALSANPRAKAMFEKLTSANRYAILYRIGNAKKPETRSRRIGQFVEMLARGETIHPQAP